LSINNSVAKQQAQLNTQSEKPLTPFTVAQCTPNFFPQLSQTEKEQSWLTIYPVVTQLIQHFIQLPQALLIFNARYWQAAVAVVAEALEDNFPQLALQNYDQQKLFGRLVFHKEQAIDFQQGEIFKYNNGCLILHISPLLINPSLWFLLKAFLINRQLPATSAVNGDKLKEHSPLAPLTKLNTKIILVANRFQLDELAQIDPEYSQVSSLFSELSSEIPATDENVQALQTYCYQLVKQRGLAKVSTDALALLFHHLSSKCGHQKKILFSPEIIENLLRYAKLYCLDDTEILAEHLQKVLDIQAKAQSLAQKFSEQALLEKQLKIQLQGNKIGQINGMSVVELMGYPTEFGEIFRVSASDMNGDGEIIDVERKVEMAGNIHAKSMLIVQGYVNHFFTHIAHFPLSCNVVFEQSYQESEGDSASLAILLAVISCYSQQPLAQNLFVTGALDQHGNVLAIGGINQKISAVTRLFHLGLLNEPVTILIPQANQINLVLEEDTLQLINAQKINIFGINHCQEAFPLAMSLSFNKVIQIINQRISSLHKDEGDNQVFGIFNRFIHLFK
jgi:Lon-like ATP-dependent protease